MTRRGGSATFMPSASCASSRPERCALAFVLPAAMPLLLRLIVPVLALLLLAAHFYRAGWMVPAALCVALTLLLAVPRPWAARTLQVALVLGALEWLRTLATAAAMRIGAGQPYLRLALILGAVAAFTLVAAWMLQHRSLRARFRLP